MGLGGQIADAAVSGCPGGQPQVQEVPVPLQHTQPHAAVPLAQVLQDHEHDAPDLLDAERFSHGDGVGQNDVLLELGGLLLADCLGAQGPKAGGDAVHYPFFRHPALHQGTGAVHPLTVGGRKLHFGAEPGYRHKLLQRDGGTQQDFFDRIHDILFVPPALPQKTGEFQYIPGPGRGRKLRKTACPSGAGKRER